MWVKALFKRDCLGVPLLSPSSWEEEAQSEAVHVVRTCQGLMASAPKDFVAESLGFCLMRAGWAYFPRELEHYRCQYVPYDDRKTFSFSSRSCGVDVKSRPGSIPICGPQKRLVSNQVAFVRRSIICLSYFLEAATPQHNDDLTGIHERHSQRRLYPFSRHMQVYAIAGHAPEVMSFSNSKHFDEKEDWPLKIGAHGNRGLLCRATSRSLPPPPRRSLYRNLSCFLDSCIT